MAESLAWLSVVGIGEDGELSPAARTALSNAALVAGGERHLALAKAHITGKILPWPSPPHDAIPQLLAMKPAPVCALVTGDPFHYGMGAVLARHIPIEEMQIFSSPSIFSLVAAKLGWALQETMMIGLNGRPVERIIPHLQPGARIIALCANETTPAALAALLKERGFGNSRFILCEQIGGQNERLRESTAGAFSFKDIAPLNCIALEIAEVKDKALPIASGIADAWFENDGQLTKREIRTVTLSALAPRRGELLWDIGLGAGSIAIEWLLANPANRAIGIEHNSERAARAARNAAKLGVSHLVIVEGKAPAALAGLEAPDAIFIGGGGSIPGLIDTCFTALKPGGRLVANAISLETEAVLLDAHKRHGGDMTRISIERADAVGSMTAWRPAMTVTQWSITK